jgi:hypothetical protein
VAIETSDLGAKIDDLEDEIDQLKRELEEARQRLNDLDQGYIEAPTQETYIPYPTRDFMGESDSYYVDPYATWTYQIIDEQGPGTSNTHVQTYPASASDYTFLEDEVRWTWPGSATNIWLNQSTTEVLDTADDSYSSWDMVKNNVTLAGEALTFDTAGDSSRSVRYTTVKVTQSFNWLVDPITDQHDCVVSLENTLGIDAVRMQVYVASNPDNTIDESTVTVTDTTNNYEMEAGRNYMVTPSGFLWEQMWFNNTVTQTYTISYSPWQSGSSIVEPMGTFDYDAASNAELDNLMWIYDEVSVSNPNNFDYTNSRITLDLSEIPGTVEMIRVRDADGTDYQRGPNLGGKQYTFYGVTIDAHGTLKLDVYVKTQSITPEAEDLRYLGLAGLIVFSILTVASFIGWMATRTDKKLDKWSDPARASFFICAVGTIASFLMVSWPG